MSSWRPVIAWNGIHAEAIKTLMMLPKLDAKTTLMYLILDESQIFHIEFF